MTLQWIIKNGFPDNPGDDNNLKKINGYVTMQIQNAISYKAPYHAEWNIMSDIINSLIDKRLNLPKQYSIVKNNSMFKNYEELSSQMNLEELPIDMKPLYGQNKEIIAIYEQMLRSEDARIDGPDVREKIVKQSLKNQIAWLYMYADDKKITSAYNKTWKNEIKIEAIDASKVHYDPEATKLDLSDCEYLIVQEKTNMNKLISEYGLERIKELNITGGSSEEYSERNYDDNYGTTNENEIKKFIYFFREANENGGFDYYSVPVVELKLLEAPKPLRPNRYPLIPYTRIKVFDDQLMGTNELYIVKDDYLSQVMVDTSLSTHAIFESGNQKLINAQNISPKDAANMIMNPNAIIGVSNTSDIRNQVVSMEKSKVPDSVYGTSNMIKQGIKDVVGITDASQGQMGSIQSGQGVATALAAANLRQKSKTATLKVFLTEYSILLKDFMSEFYNIEQVYPIPKKTSSAQFNSIFESVKEQDSEQTNQEEEKSTIALKKELKKYKIKFKEDDENVYVIAKMSDLKNMSHKVSINSDKFARMDEQSISRALETLYAMDTQDPTGVRVMTKETFIRMNPTFKGISDEILHEYDMRKTQTERNKVKFISSYVSEITKSQAAQMQQQGMDPSNINTEQIVLQALQVWMQLPENMKSDNSIASDNATGVSNNIASSNGKDNKNLQ